MPVSRKRKKKKGRKNQAPERQPTRPDLNRKLLEKLESLEVLKGAKIESGSFEVKVSELILDYGADLIANCKTESDYKKYVPFLIMCWNTANLPPEKREEAIKKMVEDFNAREIEADIRSLVDRKLEFYGGYKYFILDYVITMLEDGDIHLSVASAEVE